MSYVLIFMVSGRLKHLYMVEQTERIIESIMTN